MVLSSVDVVNIFRGRISGKQLFKNIAGTTATVAGGLQVGLEELLQEQQLVLRFQLLELQLEDSLEVCWVRLLLELLQAK